MSELAMALEAAGGADAPPESAAQLRRLLAAELQRGRKELWLARSGYPDELALGDHAVLAALPLERELRADPAAVSERGARMAAAVVEDIVAAVAPGQAMETSDLALLIGEFEGALALSYPARDPRFVAEFAATALNERFAATDRLRAGVHVVPAHVLQDTADLREPIGPTHPLRVAEVIARLGGSSLDEDSLDEHELELLRLLEPPGSVARAHEEPDPVRRVARRILQRLDGMGKWGGYHTEFVHLARGFAKGNEQALAGRVGEALLAAGLLGEKTSVGQRHVFLNPRRSGDIRRLIDTGQEPAGLRLPG